MQLFADMKDSSLHPDVITYSAAIIACEMGRQWAEALKLFADINDSSLQPNAITYSAAVTLAK